ncbi:hypothetical protein KKB06_02885, partial [Patescibacteria group bacterium]|nr:hypothetical protein [Patescibacteria group bacterium]
FIWTDNKTKYVIRGGTGSSGKREDNSRFIYALGIINQHQPVPSFLYVYNSQNHLQLLKQFSNLTVPRYDIGSNYHLEANDQKQCLSQTSLIEWEDINKLNKITIE